MNASEPRDSLRRWTSNLVMMTEIRRESGSGRVDAPPADVAEDDCDPSSEMVDRLGARAAMVVSYTLSDEEQKMVN